jgi:PiT family inorganic phosphate transporter
MWNLITWYFGIPSSSSHALIGGLIGVRCISSGLGSDQPQGRFIKVLIGLFISPLAGFVVGFFVLKIIYFLSQNAYTEHQ